MTMPIISLLHRCRGRYSAVDAVTYRHFDASGVLLDVTVPLTLFNTEQQCYVNVT